MVNNICTTNSYYYGQAEDTAKEKDWPYINTHASFTGTLAHENAAYIRWDIFMDNDPATNLLRMLNRNPNSLHAHTGFTGSPDIR